MDTIVAVATPPGRSAIGLLRLSGPRALEILRRLIGEEEFDPEPNHLTLKRISMNQSGRTLDQALVVYFAAPHSFTGEDMVEINCHGSPVIMRQLLDEMLRLDARLADPGEFTLRACRNGKMNLTQAEAIRDLINAQTLAAASQATRQLSGELSQALQTCKQQLISSIVRLESAVEFVEDDLPAVQLNDIKSSVARVKSVIENLRETYSTGHLLREGVKVTIAGRPNVGKSSLFNRLLRYDRAIVTEVAGTTRDSLTESINLGGIPVVLTDTAGIRESKDRIEEMGVERSHRAIADADLVVLVLDGSSPLLDEDRESMAKTGPTRSLIAINKSDLPGKIKLSDDGLQFSKVVHVSALTGDGTDDLIAAILEPFGNVDSENVGLMITNSRHYDLLGRARDSLDQSGALLDQSAGEEIVLVGLHNALRFLGEITGETTTEDILSEIFSTFCIGK